MGSNNQYDFEEAVFNKLGCEIHTFDPTVAVPTNDPKVCAFHSIGFGAHDTAAEIAEDAKTGWDVRNIGEVLDMLNHKDRVIDIFKIDCEGCEYKVFTDRFFSKIAERNVVIRQIQMEVHSPSGVTAEDKESRHLHDKDLPVIKGMFKVLERAGYRIFHKEPNLIADNYGRRAEFAFIKVDTLMMTEGEGQRDGLRGRGGGGELHR